MIVLAIDIIAGLPWQSTVSGPTPAQVFFDELRAHLHLRWRMEVVRGLERLPAPAVRPDPHSACGLKNQVAVAAAIASAACRGRNAPLRLIPCASTS